MVSYDVITVIVPDNAGYCDGQSWWKYENKVSGEQQVITCWACTEIVTGKMRNLAQNVVLLKLSKNYLYLPVKHIQSNQLGRVLLPCCSDHAQTKWATAWDDNNLKEGREKDKEEENRLSLQSVKEKKEKRRKNAVPQQDEHDAYELRDLECDSWLSSAFCYTLEQS